MTAQVIAYIVVGGLGLIGTGLGFILRSTFAIGKTVGEVKADVIEIKTNHLPHVDARLLSIEESLRK